MHSREDNECYVEFALAYPWACCSVAPGSRRSWHQSRRCLIGRPGSLPVKALNTLDAEGEFAGCRTRTEMTNARACDYKLLEEVRHDHRSQEQSHRCRRSCH